MKGEAAKIKESGYISCGGGGGTAFRVRTSAPGGLPGFFLFVTKEENLMYENNHVFEAETKQSPFSTNL